MGEQHPTVSVIIPTYNRAGYLQEAIASVLAQTFGDFEILVVDDGSSDTTASVVAGFGDGRIRYFYQENAGRSVARNRGLRLSKGEFIGFLDDDDLYLPGKLLQQVAYLDSHGEIGLVAAGSHILDAEGMVTRTWRTWRDQPRLELPACLYSCPLLTCTVLLRRHWLGVLDHWFDEGTEPAEDTDFWIRLLVAGCRMAWMPDIVSAYRRHPDDSQQDLDRYYRSYMQMLDKLYARVDLPSALHTARPAAYTHHHVMGACSAYLGGQIELGQQRLVQASTAAPGAMNDRPPQIVSSIIGFAQSNREIDPVALIDVVFKHLPSQMEWLRTYRRYALSALHMKRVFAARAANSRPPFRDWLLGVYYHPAWLTNRGVWSILVRDLLLRSPATGRGQ